MYKNKLAEDRNMYKNKIGYEWLVLNLASLSSSITQPSIAKILIGVIEQVKVWGFHIYFHGVIFLYKMNGWMNE